MDVQKAVEVVAKLHQEKHYYHNKSVKTKKRAWISLIIGSPCLITFIVMIVLTSLDPSYMVGIVLSIVFGVLAFIFLELAIILFTVNRCVYVRQEENRKKILTYIEKEVNKPTK